MKWFYIWSEKYVDFHKYLETAVLQNGFEVCPIYINQQRFDKELNMENPIHMWTGCNIKLEVIVDILKNRVEDDEMFVMTDVDIFLRPGSDLNNCMEMYSSFPEINMVFSPEKDNIQIGSMLIRKNKDVMTFWETVLRKCIADPTLLDQDVINTELKVFHGEWKIFSSYEVVNCLNLTEANKKIYRIFNLMASAVHKDFESNFTHKKQEFNNALEYFMSWNAGLDLHKMKMIV